LSKIVKSRPQFRSLTEQAVLETLMDDSDMENPIRMEVARLLRAYGEEFQRHVKRLGYMPDEITHGEPSCPIEAVAMSFATEAIRDAVRAVTYN
jgi:hypothetical protein